MWSLDKYSDPLVTVGSYAKTLWENSHTPNILFPLIKSTHRLCLSLYHLWSTAVDCEGVN